jgi:hypothetical protein
MARQRRICTETGRGSTIQRWVRALAIAKILFEDQGYHTVYLEEIERYLKEVCVYQPKIEDEHIRQLYQWAKRLEMPMTHLVNTLLAHALTRLEQGVENVSDPPAGAYRRRKQRSEENR